MADEKTTVIGKVAVKIFPDTSDFYRETKRDLEAAERRLGDVEVDVKLDDDRLLNQLSRLLERLNEKAREGAVDIEAKLNTASAKVQGKKLKKDLEKTLDNVEVDVKLDQTKTVLDDLKRPNLFKGLEHIEIFDPSSMRQYQTRIREINDQVRATAKLDAQRARAMAEQAQAAERQAAAERRRQADVAKSLRDQAAASAKIKKQINDAADASEKMRRELNKIQFDREFEKQAKETAALLKEIDDEVRILDKRMDFEYSVKLTGMSDAEREIDSLNERMKAAQNKLELGVELSTEERHKLIREVDSLRREIERKTDDLPVKFNLQTPLLAIRWLATRLTILARDRVVWFVPMISKAAAAKVATTLSALSGLRGAGKLLEDINDAFKNIDKNIPKIAALGGGLTTLAGWAGAAVANLFSLANSLAVVGQAGLALPGILGGMAIGAGITFIALSDLKKKIPEVTAGWKGLRKTITENFWQNALTPIKRLGSDLFPELNRGLAHTSFEIGKFFGAFADALRMELGGNPLKGMFDDLTKSVDIFTDHAGSIAKIIRILGEAGAGELPRLAQWFGTITDRFSNFLDKADKSGELKEWIDEGIAAMKELGGVVKGVVRIFSGLGKAAIAGGASTLETLNKKLNAIADVINGPAFQGQMIKTLKAANGAMEDIGRISGPAVTNMFMTLGATAEKIFPILGRTVGLAFKTIADAIANPRVQQGLVDFFSGIESAVKTLAPAFDSLAPAFGSLLSLLGEMAKAFAPIGKVLLETIAQAFIKLAPHLEKVVSALSGGVVDLIKALAPAVLAIADASGPAIETIAEALADVAEALAPVVAQTAKDLAKWITETLKSITPAAAKGFADGIEKLATSLLHVIDALLKGKDGEVTSWDLGGFLMGVGDLAEQTAKAMEWVAKNLPGFIQTMKDFDAATDPDQFVGGDFDLKEFLLGPHFDEIGPALDGVLKWFEELPSKLGTLISTDGTWSGIGRDIMRGLTEGIVAPVQDLLTAWNGICNTVITFVKGLFGIHSPSTVFAEIGGFLIAGLVQGIGQATGLTEAFTTLVGKIKGFFEGAGTWLTEKGTALVNGLRNGITPGPATSKMGEVKSGINSVLSNAASFLDPRGGQLVKGLAGGMGKLMGDVKDKGKAALKSAQDGTSGADTSLKSAGISVIDGFVRYIENGFSKVEGVLRRLTNLLPDWKGPRSTDQVILKEAGQLVIQGFVAGLESQFSLVKDTLGNLSDEIGSTQIAGPTIGKISTADMAKLRAAQAQIAVPVTATEGGPTTDGGITFQIENHNPVAEPTSVTITKALRTAGQMGVVRR